MAAPARVAARTAKTLDVIVNVIYEVKAGLSQLDQIEAKLDQLLAVNAPTKADALAAHTEAVTATNRKAK